MKKCLLVFIAALFSFALSAEETQQKVRFYFFYSESCPHCHEAMPFIESLEKEFPDIEFNRMEVSQSPENLAVFNKKMEKLGTKVGGVPTFVFKDKYVVGFKKGVFEEKIRAMIVSPEENPATQDKTPKKEVKTTPDETEKSLRAKNPATQDKTPKKTVPTTEK